MKGSLREYNKKRDFKKTKEPSGKKVTRKNKKLIFVVQEHHARRLHYDFRLELDGVLKSWAVPKGPSLDPKDKRLAVQTEDHPIEYAKFHGRIPEGEYGAGEVFIWDSGVWESEIDDPREGIKRGELKFRLKGKKLNGSFVLVRIRRKGEETKENWLLIKHRDEIQGNEQKASSKKISKKSKKKIANLGNDPWPDFIQPQLPRLINYLPEEKGVWVYEMKFDGYRMQGHVKNNLGQFFTRNALNWSNAFPHLLNALEHLPVHDAIFDGEVVALDDEGRSHFQKLQNSLKSKNDKDLRYYIFDLLYLNGKDLRKIPLIERKAMLEEILKGAPPHLQMSEHFFEDGKEFYQVSCEHKLEGVISKMADSPYSSGRSDLWVKTKCTNRQEFVIGGWTGPKGGRVGLGALLLGVFENGKLRYVGKVGTGFNQKTLTAIRKELEIISQEDSPFDLKSPKDKNIHWVKPKKICEVSFGSWTNEGILRTAVFIGMREDKTPKEIHMEKPKAHLKLVENISSPEKILFRKDKKTKEDVALYYQEVGETMLPYVSDRPLSLVRCPNGSSGKCFFQKHFVGNTPESFHTFPIKEEKGKGIYMSIDSVAGLLDLVQLNAYEIHAWNCDKENYLRPNQIVMDFDPGPGVLWKDVVKGALELKEMLLDLDLESYVKVTGGKGIHVHIPVAPLYDWEQIKNFSQTLALEMVSRHPDLYVANMSKKLRKKKIFLDYLRNGYGATAVVPYSLRKSEQTAVALPIEWDELKRIKSADQFTMEKALRKIRSRKRDPWEGMNDLDQKIPILKEAKKAA